MLHLIRSAPDSQTMELIETMVQRDKDRVIHLYDGPQEWDRIIERIFHHEKVTCWW